MKGVKLMSIGVVSAIALMIGANVWYQYGTVDMIHNVIVEDRERIVETTSEGGTRSRYLIFTENEVFQNVDSPLHLKFNSTDVYRDMSVGKVCTLKVQGFRIHFMSSYRNIIHANCKQVKK